MALLILGMVIFLSALLGYVGRHFGEINFRVGTRLEPLPRPARRDRAA